MQTGERVSLHQQKSITWTKEEDKDGPARTPEEEHCRRAHRKSLHSRVGFAIPVKWVKPSNKRFDKTCQRWLEAGGIKGALVMCLQQSGNNSHQGLRLKLLSLRHLWPFFKHWVVTKMPKLALDIWITSLHLHNRRKKNLNKKDSCRSCLGPCELTQGPNVNWEGGKKNRNCRTLLVPVWIAGL